MGMRGRPSSFGVEDDHVFSAANGPPFAVGSTGFRADADGQTAGA